MKYRRALLAAVLAGVAFPASAQFDVIVKLGEPCPFRTVPSVPSYTWKDGRFVLDGQLCESVDKSKN